MCILFVYSLLKVVKSYYGLNVLSMSVMVPKKLWVGGRVGGDLSSFFGGIFAICLILQSPLYRISVCCHNNGCSNDELWMRKAKEIRSM